MALPALNHAYRYAGDSTVELSRGGARLSLATSSADLSHPYFFEGRVRRPRQLAGLLLLVARVARARFHVPPAMLARILLESDPVVTCDAGHVRFESLSACCGVYARVDVPHACFEASIAGRGTTNVDLNPPARAALAQVGDDTTLEVSVGRDELAVAVDDERTVERKVVLPARWIRGFLEVQAYQSRMREGLSIRGADVSRFFRGLPRQRVRDALHVVPAGRGVRLSRTAARDGVQLGGIERLRLLDPVAPAASTLTIHGEPGGASGWVLTLPGDVAVSLVLSPSAWRGFSGEGQALEALGRDDGATAHVRSALRWQGTVDAAALAGECGTEAAHASLARLGATGAVGFDLVSRRYFHRELPFDLSQVERLQPRLRDARKLVESGAVTVTRVGDEALEASVPGSGVEHRVRIGRASASCTCPWYSRHRGARGPCKHILAAQIVGDADER